MGATVEFRVDNKNTSTGEVEGWEDFLRMVEKSGIEVENNQKRFELLEELSVTHNWFTVGRYVDNVEKGHVVLRYVDYLKVEPSEDAKVIAANLKLYEQAERLLKRQINVLPELDHSNLAKVHGCHFTEEGDFVIKREYIRGESLEAKVERGGIFKEKKVKEIILNVAKGIKELHQYAIHRDLKPSNVIIDENSQPVVTDFDILSDGINSDGGSTCLLNNYTSGYMPPEGLYGKSTKSLDVYSLGVFAVRLLTREDVSVESKMNPIVNGVPTIGKHFRQHCKYPISDSFAAILKKMLQPGYESRYQNMDEVIAALEPRPIEVKKPAQRKISFFSKHYESVTLFGIVGSLLAAIFIVGPAVKKKHNKLETNIAVEEVINAEIVNKVEKKEEPKGQFDKVIVGGMPFYKDDANFVKGILKMYDNPQKVRAIAKKYENGNDWEMAVTLYRGINEQEAANRILRREFIRGGYSADTFIEEFGFSPTLNDWLEMSVKEVNGCRIYVCLLGDSYRYLRKSNDTSGLIKLAKTAEAKAETAKYGSDKLLELARDLYSKAKDEEGVGRIGRKVFKSRKRTIDADEARKLGVEITPEMYNERGDYWYNRIRENLWNIRKAFVAYEKAGNEAKMKKALRRAEKDKSFGAASDFALALGQIERAQQNARKSLVGSGLSLDAIERTLSKVGLANDKGLYREIAQDRVKRGYYQEAIAIYEHIGDEGGKLAVLEKLTSE